jgi:hypothetical protein
MKNEEGWLPDISRKRQNANGNSLNMPARAGALVRQAPAFAEAMAGQGMSVPPCRQAGSGVQCANSGWGDSHPVTAGRGYARPPHEPAWLES